MIDLEPYLAYAVDLAVEAGRRTLEHYQTGVRVELKADQSPVTLADLAAERFIREGIARRFPHHAIAGEEYGSDANPSPFRWIVDPIDGTRSFIRGVPLFGTLIGLEIEGTVHVGVCHLPVLHETVAAATGHGCWFNLRRAHVSTVDTLEAATLVCSDTRTAGRRLAGQWAVMEARTALQRTWGDCYGHCLVATGRADIMLDPVMNPWDCAPFVPILQEAGGRFTDWRGHVRIDGGDAVSTNGLLHPHVLELLAAAAHEVR